MLYNGIYSRVNAILRGFDTEQEVVDFNDNFIDNLCIIPHNDAEMAFAITYECGHYQANHYNTSGSIWI
jgi:hypothetical protein